MTHLICRGKHCNIEYSYQSSGHGCFEPTNDSIYCPACYAIVLAALKNIPVKIKFIYLPAVYNEVTLEEMENKRASDKAEPYNLAGLLRL